MIVKALIGEALQAKLDEKDAELAALRGFAQDMHEVKTINSFCECGEPVFVETGRLDVCRRDGKRPYHPGSSFTTTQFRCRKCHKWLADSCKDAAFGENIR